MTTATALPISRPDAVRPTHQPGFTDLLRSEWTKVRSLRSTWWALGATVVVSIGITILATSLFAGKYTHLSAAEQLELRDNAVGLFLQPGFQFGQLAVAVLGALVISSEYSTGMIRATVLSAPRRVPVFAAKAAVLAAVVFAVSEVIGWTCFFVGSAIAHPHVVVTVGTPGTVRAVLAFGVVMAIIALVSLALGELLRHTAGAISVALGLSLVLPIVLGLIPGSLGGKLQDSLPASAGQLILQRTTQAGDPWTQWQGLGIAAAWAVVLLAVGCLSISRRDV